jgi:hypothetical protein
MSPWQGWHGSLAAAGVLLLLAVAIVAGVAVVALLSKGMPALGLGRVKTFGRVKAIEQTFCKLSLRCAEIRKRV